MRISKLLPQKLKNIFHLFNALFHNAINGFPSRNIKFIGVTGTDGKTTTTNMIYEILNSAGKRVGLLSSINAKSGKLNMDTGFHVTTPDPKLLFKIIKKMKEEGIEYIVLETTSHALDQHRIAGIRFEVAVFTNISHEHLDYHKTYDNYLNTKASLIRKLNRDGMVVLNKDDDNSYNKLDQISKDHMKNILTYSIEKEADYFVKKIKHSINGSTFELTTKSGVSTDIKLALPGKYNISNALAAICTASALNIDTKHLKNGLEAIKTLEGRWEVIQSKPFSVVVDFAHTPNSLENVLKHAKELTKGKLITVFGSAGYRDEHKRPLMGKASAKYSDITILTAEDPRGLDINSICNEIADGLVKSGKVENKDYYIITDRREAIKYALSIVSKDDTVIISGKGHEKSMNLDGVNEIAWSDQEVVRELLGK